MKTIGILGGMGPAASANFYQKIISLAQEKYGAVQDTDFPPIILYSIALEGFEETGIVDEQLVLKQLKQGIKELNQAGAEIIAIPCNTVHFFIRELQKVSKAPILDIIKETTKLIEEKEVGLLASETTLQLQLYQQKLKSKNIHFKTTQEPQLTTQLILEVMQGKVKNSTKQKVLNSIKKMEIKSLILGCTELPLAITSKNTGLKIYDSLTILAESILFSSKKFI